MISISALTCRDGAELFCVDIEHVSCLYKLSYVKEGIRGLARVI